jgi:hypothetical protein
MQNAPKPSLISIPTLITAVGVVMVWRGIWGLMDIYLFPGQPTLSYGLSIVIGLVILYIDDKAFDELRHR